jgi:Amt family ammonium transporter
MEPHNIPFVVLGAGLLWFGWFGFNAGSALVSGGSATLAFVATNTSAAVAALTWVALSWKFTGKVSVVGAATGAVAGLASITPAAGFVGPMPAMVIGLGAGSFCYLAVWFINKVRLDDTLDVWGVHAIGSTWGMVATGLFVGVGVVGLGFSDFALEGMSRGEQVLRQVGAIGVAWGWAFSMTLVILFALKFTLGLRVSEEDEEKGLDLSQHGEQAYRN